MSRPTAEIVERVKKCLALSKSNFEGEAANALSLATKLMAEHGLSMADVELEKDGHIKPGTIVEDKTELRRMDPWEKTLAMVPSGLLPVECFFRSLGKNQRIVYIGTESDAALAVAIYKALRDELVRIGRGEPEELARRSFRNGAADQLFFRSIRLRKEREAAAKAPEDVPKTGTELMVVKQGDVVAYKESLDLRPNRDRGSAVLGDAYGRGRTHAASMNLNFHKAIGGNE